MKRLERFQVRCTRNVMCQNKIAQITGEVPQHVVFIPETLSPHFTAPTIEIRHTG